MEVSISDLQQEALRLIDLQTLILSRLEEHAGPSSGYGEDFGREALEPDRESDQFSVEAIHDKKKLLEEHRVKVERLDMVLAVVGTMKAGKSTSINAIVGREILPNRNRPMTALPTLIRHCPSQTEPVLKFQNRQPIVDLLTTLRTKVQDLSQTEMESRLAEDKHLEEIVRQVTRGDMPEAEYQGEDGIYEFLSYLNDLVRLAAAINVPFPFNEYASIEDFPVIEVEFFHLARSSEANLGRFSVLDTPGFNEAGQKDSLLPMMRDQLKKASAVLAVLDYTQLKSESEGELRKELNEIASTANGRMFALVNKFDDQDRNSADESETRAYVANHLVRDAGIKPEHVYPVSARSAYLSQQAKLTLDHHGSLDEIQDSETNRWVPDFGKAAFGFSWKSKISDPAEVMGAADWLWGASNFEKPLRDVIHFGHASAAIHAIDAASARLNHDSKELDLLLTSRRQMLEADAEDIKKLLEDSKAQIRSFDEIRETAEEELRAQISHVNRAIKAGQVRVGEEVQKAIQEFLKNGALNAQMQARSKLTAALKGFKAFKVASNDERERLLNFGVESAAMDVDRFVLALERLKKKNRTASLEDLRTYFSQEPADVLRMQKILSVAGLFGGILNQQSGVTIISDDAEYGSREDAQKKLTQTDEVLRTLMLGSRANLELVLEDAQRELHDRTQALTAKIVAGTSQFSEDAATVGVAALQFDVPEVPKIQFSQALTLQEMSLIDDESYGISRRVEQSGVLAWFKRRVDYFGGDWGYDEYSSTKPRFVINMKKLQEHWLAMFEDESATQQRVVREEFAQPIMLAEQRFFEAVEARFALIQESLENGLRDHEESEQTRAAIARFLTELSALNSDIKADSKALSRTVSARLTLSREDALKEVA